MTEQKRFNSVVLIISIATLAHSSYSLSYVNSAKECSANPSKSCDKNFLNQTKQNLPATHKDNLQNIPDSPPSSEALYFEQFNHLLNFSSNAEISSECRNSVRRLEELAKKFDLTALKILDASAKINSGLLNGNLNSYGDFDMCLAAKSRELKGKYCLADIHFHLHKSLEQFRDLIIASEPYSNSFDGAFHITPKTSNILWAVCMPSECTHNDLEAVIKTSIKKNFGKYIKSIELTVKEKSCQVAEDESKPLSLATKLSIGLFVLILLISCLSTFYDSQTSGNENRNEIYLAFSMKKNFNEIISTKINDKEIKTLNGIRFINTVIILFSHKCMEVQYQLIANRTHLRGFYEGVFSVPFRGAYLNTEVFLMISGLLTTYSLVGRFNRGEKVGIAREIITRYLRYMPPIAALIIFHSYVFPIINNGPIWPLLIDTQADICKAYSWRNVLMIHNWFNFQDMCMFHTHHVGTDFTLFAISIFLIVKLHKYPRYNTMVFLLIAIVSSAARFYVVYSQKLAIYVRFGASVESLIDVGNNMYAIPPYRFTCYIIGVYMGYVLRNSASMTLTTRTLLLGWILSTLGFIITAVISIKNNYEDDALLLALFAAVAPLTLCMFFAWIIFVSHCGLKNAVASFFEWKYFKITTSLSYGLYLGQFAVFSYNAGVARVPFIYSYYDIMFDLNEILLIATTALILTLFIELPFENLRKKIFDTKSTSKSDVSKTD